MISLEHLIAQGEDFGVHCSTESEFHILINHISANYPLKRNERIDKFRAWSDFGSSIVVYPNFHNCNRMSYGRLGGNASLSNRRFANRKERHGSQLHAWFIKQDFYGGD